MDQVNCVHPCNPAFDVSNSSPLANEQAFERFATVAGELGILPFEEAVELSRAAAKTSQAPWQFGFLTGKISATDTDILATMLSTESAIPGYQVLGVLGRGGMGVVYKAKQESLGRLVALKTILLSQLSKPAVAQRFEQEARSLASAMHPNIVTAYDFGRHTGRLYLAMEFVQGKDASRLMAGKRAIDESLTWNIIRQAAAGLAHAHSVGIVHRDIKPANLLLLDISEQQRLLSNVPLVKIADFGLALLAETPADDKRERLTGDGSQMGSPNYMSPEQIDSSDVDFLSDIFSLGATAWHMLLGRPPLAGLPLGQLLTERMTKPTELVTRHNAQLCDESAQLVAEMMSIKPSDRPPDYVELIARIDRLLNKRFLSKQSLMTLPPSNTPELEDAVRRVAEEETIDGIPSLGPSTSIDSKTTRNPKRQIAYGLVGGLLLAVASFGYFLVGPAIETPQRLYSGAGNWVALFDGETLAGWRTLRGAWRPGVDSEGGSVLMGTDGLVSHFVTENSEIDEHFAWELTLASSQMPWPENEQIEVQWDFDPNGVSRDFLALRFRRDGGQVLRADNHQQVGNKELAIRVPNEATALSVRIERQSDFWWIIVDSRVVAFEPFSHQRTSQELRLMVDRGTAQFSDIAFERLQSVARTNEL